MISIAFVFGKSNSPSFLFSLYLHLSVSAYSIIGEGDKITINNIYSSSIPGKITSISLVDASNDKIKIKWNIPSDNGGSRITSYEKK